MLNKAYNNTLNHRYSRKERGFHWTVSPALRAYKTAG
jgi:hypothetical protein